jgi:hypothetical protein
MRRGGERETISEDVISQALTNRYVEQPYLAPKRLRTTGLEQSQRLYLVCVPKTWMASMPGKLRAVVI